MRQIIIGDVHGCLSELIELIEQLEVTNKDRLVFLGDLIDRGPHSVETVRYVRELECEAIMGNHEEKCTRWRYHEARRRATGRPNPMRKIAPDRKAEWEAFSEDEIEWMRNLPITLQLTPDWIAVHGGLEPKPLSEQQNGRMIRMRYLDSKTLEPVPLEYDLEQPADTMFWSELWEGPQSVVYGHAVHGNSPRVDWCENPDYPDRKIWCIGVDTGACFGGMLTALVTDDDFKTWNFAQVKAKKAYRNLIPGMNAGISLAI